MRSIIAVALVGLLLAACGTARRGEPVAGLLVIPTEKIARGERYYMTYCNKCHPTGESGLGLAINNKPLPATLIKTQVRLGAGAMPSFSKDFLSDEKLDDIIAYLELLRKH